MIDDIISFDDKHMNFLITVVIYFIGEIYRMYMEVAPYLHFGTF